MEQLDVVRFVVEVCERLGLRYAIVGSYASTIYGEGRFTLDVDILVDLSPENVPEFCEQFPAEDWYFNESTAVDAVRRRKMFNILHPATSHKIDVMIPADTEWGRQQLARRMLSGLLPDHPVYTAHPEDIILSKLRYYKQGESDKHLRDIVGMLKNSPELIDQENVARWAESLHVLDVWEMILQRIRPSDEPTGTAGPT